MRASSASDRFTTRVSQPTPLAQKVRPDPEPPPSVRLAKEAESAIGASYLAEPSLYVVASESLEPPEDVAGRQVRRSVADLPIPYLDNPPPAVASAGQVHRYKR